MIQTGEQLHVAYNAARIGQAIQYYQGFLMEDREVDLNIAQLGDTARFIANTQGGFLFQRRHGEGMYGYFLVKSTTNRVDRLDRWIRRWAPSRGCGATQ